MKSLSDEAVVIGFMDYRESDRIVHFYTKEHGRMSGIARGAKKSAKRFAGSFDLFARLSLTFCPAENLASISTAEPMTIYPGIRQNLNAFAHASYAVELVTALTPERLVNKRVFRLLTAYLDRLDTLAATSSDRHFFEINLLNILGYRPPLESCAECGVALSREGGFWSPGKIHWLRCQRCSGGGFLIDGTSIALLVDSIKTGRFGSISFSTEGIGAVERFLEAFISANVSRPLKSLAFLRLYP